MSYNWIDAATPQGRERLEELTDNGIVVARMTFAPDEIGQCYWMDGFRLNLCGEVVRTWDEAEHSGYTDDGRSILDCIEFLDPDQDSQIAALKAENERMKAALIDIESDARAKLAANLPMNSNETLHSAKHGLGQLLENGKSGDIGSVIDAIARAFKGNDDFCA